uniref:Uncharacterized protein n=1 Tax=Cucumis melo TaxID=3656 RepID=A0A9I9D8G6_CUCME
MSSLATVMATRRPKWQYPQPAPPTPRILHFPRRPRMRRRPSKSLPTKPTSDGRGKLEALFGQEREFLKEGFPVVLMDGERERGGYGVGAAAAEEKWRFQAEMLRAECNLLRMEREITNKKLEKMKSRMERTLKSAVQALISGRNKIYEGKDTKMVLEDEINHLAQKLERLRRGSRDKQIELKKSSNFDKQASLLQKKLEKIGEDTDELKVIETKKTCRDQESFISNGKFNVRRMVDVLKRKMEDLSKGTLLERMREECRSMLSTPATSSVRTATLANLDSTLQEQNQCSGHCKAIIRRITEQVKAEKDQWSQMQEMLNQVREEMEELQVSREFWKDQALESESQIQSLQSSVEEWKEKAMAHESKVKKKGQGSVSPPDEMEKHVLICRVKEKKNHNLVLHARDVRSRRREISIDELQQEQQQQQQKLHTQIKTIEKIQRLPFREIGNHLHK